MSRLLLASIFFAGLTAAADPDIFAGSWSGETTPVFSFTGMLAALPLQPTDADHPGSNVYPYQYTHETLQLNGRAVEVYLPKDSSGNNFAAPVVVYGHGQATPVEGYEATFVHMARKGVAVIFPAFDNGFFDQDWPRMAKDFNDLTAETLRCYPQQMDAAQVSYSGHSKGAYIALMAAGAPNLSANARPKSLVLFAPAGYDAAHLARLDPAMPITLVWGDADTVVTRASVMEVYNRAPSVHKQFIKAKSYPELTADHFFVLNKSFFFGGRDGVSAFHYFAAWKWILGAAWDTSKGAGLNDPFIYGDETASTGVDQLKHSVTRNW